MIKYLIMDVDGTLTDGKIYMGENGEVMKAFSVKDGYVFNYILKPERIIPVIITARSSKIVQNRCDELGIKEVHQGKLDKLKALREIVGEENLGQCAYFGDDVLDLQCMNSIKEAGGIVGCPADAVREVKAVSDYVCIYKAGDGALREFSEWIVFYRKSEKGIKKRIKDAIEYIKHLDSEKLKVGKYEVNENFYYSVQSYLTQPAEQCRLESHKKYVDIQFIVKGKEQMDLADVSRLVIEEHYDLEKDVIFWKVPERMLSIVLREGDCIVLYPENAHRGAIVDSERNDVIKIVGKVKL